MIQMRERTKKKPASLSDAHPLLLLLQHGASCSTLVSSSATHPRVPCPPKPATTPAAASTHHRELGVRLARERLVGAVVLTGAKVLRALDAQHAVQAVGPAAVAAAPGRRALAHHDVVLVLHLALAVAEDVVRYQLPHGRKLCARGGRGGGRGAVLMALAGGGGRVGGCDGGGLLLRSWEGAGVEGVAASDGGCLR